MPFDNMFDDDGFKRRCIGWDLKFCFLPKRCFYTGKYMWFKKAYIGTAMVTGPGEPIFEDRWCDPKKYLFLKIKGTI
jgi:hypothetical protein